MFIREKPYHLDLSYKGERCYLHGTDIAFQLCKVLDISGEVTIQFYKMATYPILAYHVDTDELSKLRSLGKMCALMSYRDTNQEIRIVALVEDKFKVISKRKAYSESKVILGANIVNDEIVQLVANQGNFFERVVALNKELLNRVVSENSWVFGRINLLTYPIDPASTSIKLSGELGGNSYKSSIFGDNTLLGDIFFSRRKDDDWN